MIETEVRNRIGHLLGKRGWILNPESDYRNVFFEGSVKIRLPERYVQMFGKKRPDYTLFDGISPLAIIEAKKSSVFQLTDALKQARAYLPLGSIYQHESVNHSAGEYVRGKALTNSIESFWALLKRGYVGVFHDFTWKHLDRYLEEFSHRWNMLDLTSEQRIDAILNLGVRLESLGKAVLERDYWMIVD